ncbi:MAG: hypothetical protein A3B68_03820 [Candidatus Melainabacteria bacterium RIFCSPHIGHO2_02_FULL_34_12]|nr:MAG: hypothetical protein A3B68_03820 [Candidatus Melainabacteria bacterium RIFCSPHIGHO2_02_FULL_34_12]
MSYHFQKRTYESWKDLDTKSLLYELSSTKEKISHIDLLSDDFSLTGNLLIDLYEIAEEVEKRLLLF